MNILSDEVVRFFHRSTFTVVSTIDSSGRIHNSCKGVVDIDESGKVYLLDLYKARTYQNLGANDSLSVTVIDEHKFKGYCLIGKAKITQVNDLKGHIIEAWEKKITDRISKRIVKNIKGEKGHPRHPESQLPTPEYLIEMDVERIVDLTPNQI
ncbi:pyridoxamine 5'-phosphate oxidase family protein [Candidatus Omnitrophota bacterium]